MPIAYDRSRRYKRYVQIATRLRRCFAFATLHCGFEAVALALVRLPDVLSCAEIIECGLQAGTRLHKVEGAIVRLIGWCTCLVRLEASGRRRRCIYWHLGRNKRSSGLRKIQRELGQNIKIQSGRPLLLNHRVKPTATGPKRLNVENYDFLSPDPRAYSSGIVAANEQTLDFNPVVSVGDFSLDPP